jgi:hypothetical protein
MKIWAPKASLGTLFLAAIWLDLMWPLFVLLGLEDFRISPGITKVSPFDFTDYPLSHSLVMALAWAAAWGLGALAYYKDARTAWILGALVASHWLFDLLVHRPDLPILPTGEGWKKVGMGLWNSALGTVVLETGFLAVGAWLYLTATEARKKAGEIGAWLLVAFLAVTFAMSLNGTPPDNPKLVAVVSFSQLLVVGWAYWLEDQRKEA